MKMKYCEVCGTMGIPGITEIIKTCVEGSRHSDEYYLCETCYEEWEMFSLEGNNREALLGEMRNSTMSFNGPRVVLYQITETGTF